MQLDLNFFKIFQSANSLILIGSVLFIGALIVFIRVINRIYASIFHRPSTLIRRRHLSFQRGLFNLSLALTVLLLALALLLAGTTLKNYTTFTRVELVGIVECLEWNPSEKNIVIRFSSMQKGKISTQQTFSLHGEQWEINAHILKWAPYMNLLGLHTGYRLNQIKGTYIDAQAESQGPHSAYNLNLSQDWIWGFLSRYGDYLPMVEAVYGNAVSRPAKPGEQFNVFVTTSGLSIRRRSQP